MKIEELELPKPERRWKEQRCCKIVRSTGTTYFEGRTNRCGRMARFKINKIAFCTQHAGEQALKYLIHENARPESDDKRNLTEGPTYSESPARPNRATDGGRKQTECDE